MKKIRTYSLCVVILLSGLQLSAQKRVDPVNLQPSYPLLDSAKRYQERDPALAFDFVLQMMDIAVREKDRYAQGECYHVIGNINFSVRQYDLAIDNYSKALDIFREIKHVEKTYELEALLGKTYEAKNELEKSETLYKSNVQSAMNTADSRKVRASRRNLANVYQKKGDEEEAIRELEEVRQMDISEGDPGEQLLTNQMLIEAYAEKQPQKALDLTEENESIATSAYDTIALLNTLQERANIYENLGRNVDRINTLQEVIDFKKKQNDLSGQSVVNLDLSDALLKEDKMDDAISLLKESVEMAEKTGNTETRKRALKSLSSAYEQSGDLNLAYNAFKEYVEAAERSALEREEEIQSSLELMQSLTERLQRIDMLENQQRLDDRTIELLRQESMINSKSLKQQRLIILSLLTGILMLLGASYLVIRSSRQKRLANQLLALRSLRSQMNPHFIFNALNSVNNYISQSDERSANKYLSEFSKLMREVMENSKHDFVPLSSEVQILERYLKLEHHRFRDKFDYSFTVDPELDQENVQVPPMLIQPYIENAIWHGLRYKEEKGYLKVELKNGDHLQVLVEDNGIGRQKSKELKTKNQQTVGSTGMKNIENRVKIINQLHNIKVMVCIEDLDKEQHSGTRVKLDIFQNGKH